MNDTQNQNLEKIIKLQLLFGELYDENFKTKNKEVYNAKIKDFNDELKSVGVDPNLSPKEIELKLQQIYEALEKEPLTKTTLNKDESEQLIKDSEKREADISKIKEGQEKAVEDFIKRNREKITKTQSVQEDIKDKKVYLKVEETEKTEFSVEEKEVFEQYKKEAVENPEEASIKMAREIHTRVDGVLKEQGLPQEEIENIVNKTAEKIVENIAVFDTPNYVPATMHIAINNAVFEKIPTTISKEAQEVIKSSIATNSVYRFQPDLFLKDVTKTAFGDKFAKIIFGADPNSYKISVSEIPTQQYSYTYSFSTINESSVQVLNEQNQTVEILKGFGKDEARNYLINQSSAYFSKTAIGQKILSNSKTEIAFYSVFKSAGKTVTWTGGNFVGNAILKFAPEYAPVVNLLTGTKFVTPVVTQTATKIAGQAVGKAAGQVATEAVVGTAAKTGIAASMSATFAALGSWAPIVGNAIGAVVGYLFGKVLEKIDWTKVKKFFSDNKIWFGVGAGIGGMMVFGPVGGLFAGGLFLAATGSLGAFAAGAFGVLGFIGRSVGIAIATPVIVTLLVIPPLVAFIMLVINNSAYIVPPAPVAESGFGPGQGGFVCTQDKTPTTITSSVNSPIATRAWEIMEDMYQGFWCFWNRSPGDLATDTITHPPSYPELFNEKLFAVKPNPTRDEVSSCGECLFWCTWLVQKSYKENGVSIMYTLWSPTMMSDFDNRGKLITGREMTKDNIQSGAVIFFDIKNSLNRIDHVGIVHSVSPAGIKFLQSNAGTKDDFIPFGTDGVLQNPSYATIGGIGNP